jgi:hypothetical protein
MSPRRANRLNDWMLKQSLVEFDSPASELLTNKYVALAVR